MEETNYSPRSSVYVAPLRIEKAKRSPGTASRSPRKSSSRSRNHSRNRSLGAHSHSSSTHQQITPPPTPRASQESLAEQDLEPEFHPFLRAFYPFHPTYSTNSSSTVTLPLNSGDLILVHSVHTNGWADGTMLSSGARGWLPTNYCETYETTHIRLLLKASLNLFEQFRVGSNSGARINQIAVTGIVAGVRQLLESTECLTREASNVQSSDAIRKSRKVLLTELSGLVKSAKKLPAQTSQEHADEIADELILRSFKIVLRGVRFLDVWYDQYEIASSCIDSYIEGDDDLGDTVPPTPPCDGGTALSRMGSGSESNTDGYFGTQAAGHRDLAGGRRESHPLPSTPYTETLPDSVDSPDHQPVGHRAVPEPLYALAQLNACHDILLSYLGSYIGRIHLQARYTPQLQLTQQQSVAAARDLLAVVEAIYARDPRAKALEAAKEAMYYRIASLISAAQDVVSNRIEEDMDEDEDGVLIPNGGRSLVEAATGCVRGAGECVAKSKFVIERTGDFKLELDSLDIGLGITTDLRSIVSRPDSQATVEENVPAREVHEDSSRQDAIDRKMMPPPPPPDKVLPPAPAPPPPPPTPDKILPPLPPKGGVSTTVAPALTLTVNTNLGPASAAAAPLSPARIVQSPGAVHARRSSVASLLGPLPGASLSLNQGEYNAIEPIRRKDAESKSMLNKSVRADSIGAESITATDSTGVNSIRGSEFSMISQTSTRATTPEPASSTSISMSLLAAGLLGSSQVSLLSGSECECNSELHAEDLTYNKDGQITGGTLPSLVEKLTVHDSTPDAVFVATFYLTFRLFSSPKEFAEALVDRFDSVAGASGAKPVHLRVYNVFKGWLESHWRKCSDAEALDVITNFADTRLKEFLPAPARRLQELAEKVSAVDGPLVPRLVSGMGKTTSSSTTYSVPETPILPPSITRGQLNALKASLTPGGPTCSVLDFDPLELARQFTLKESRMFCSIRPEELIAQEWTRKKGSLAVNVLSMSSLSTDLAHLVAESILDVQDTKKRAVVIKHWIKIADRCLELNNYDSLMAIMCTLNTSTIVRLKKTWELVSFRTKQVLDNLRSVIDVSKNHAVLRARLRSHVPPCLPFLGTYLTDLTFVDVGNPSKRPVSIDGSTKQLINFDKHVKTARIISELQRFQIPYRIAEVPEMQAWIDVEIDRIHNSKAADVQHLYRRSLLLEPRENQIQRIATEAQIPPPPPPVPQKEPSGKTDLFAWAHVFKTPAN